MNLAVNAAERSTCPKRHVGAILVDYQNYVISTGYNGSKPGEPHCDDVGCLPDKNDRCIRTIHAERNAIKRVSRWKRRGSRLYITDFPCFNCANLVVRSGIVELIYQRTLSRSPQPVLNLFETEGIVYRQHDPR